MTSIRVIRFYLTIRILSVALLGEVRSSAEWHAFIFNSRNIIDPDPIFLMPMMPASYFQCDFGN